MAIKPITPSDRVYPMCGWQTGSLPEQRVVVFQPHYYEDETPPFSEPFADKIFVLPVEQIQNLIDALRRAADEIPPPPSAPKLRLIE